MSTTTATAAPATDIHTRVITKETTNRSSSSMKNTSSTTKAAGIITSILQQLVPPTIMTATTSFSSLPSIDYDEGTITTAATSLSLIDKEHEPNTSSGKNKKKKKKKTPLSANNTDVEDVMTTTKPTANAGTNTADNDDASAAADTPTSNRNSSNKSKSNKKGGGKLAQQIIEPNIEDVLCGRGGMSNHHPGNEWYRRLIRSNRNLYSACPKHTKLLVAKAIVQAVQEQNGRFLERDIQTGLWYMIDYKRAVDKTSQGLREKDRTDKGDQTLNDDDDIDGSGTNKKKPRKDNAEQDGSQQQYTDEQQQQQMDKIRQSLNVPIRQIDSNGSNNHASYHDLNDIRNDYMLPEQRQHQQPAHIAQAPFLKPVLKKPSQPNPSIGVQQPITTVLSPTTGSATSAGNINMNMNNYEFWKSQKQQSDIDIQNIQPATAIPPPQQETQLLRDASMIRLLQETQLLPCQTSMIFSQSVSASSINNQQQTHYLTDSTKNSTLLYNDQMNQNNHASNNSTSTTRMIQLQHEAAQNAAQHAISVYKQQQQQQQQHYNSGSNDQFQQLPQNNNNMTQSNFYNGTQSSMTNYNDESTIMPDNSSTNNNTIPMNGLTRLKSQVSDWLNIFWPTNTTAENESIGSNQNQSSTTNNGNLPHHDTFDYSNGMKTTATLKNQYGINQMGISNYNQYSTATDSVMTTTGAVKDELIEKEGYVPNVAAAAASSSSESESSNHTSTTTKFMPPFHRQLSNEIDSTEPVFQHQSSFFSLPSPTSDASSSSNNNKRQRDEVGEANYRYDAMKQPYKSYLVPRLDNNNIDEYQHSEWKKSKTMQQHWSTIGLNNGTSNNARNNDAHSNNNDPMNTRTEGSTTKDVTTAPFTVNAVPPTELEQSVSKTLLELAASPSRLFSGLSSFFNSNPSTTIMSTTSQTNNDVTIGQDMIHTNVLDGRKTRQKEQCPMYESRFVQQSQKLIASHYHHDPTTMISKPNSLLDDVEETPMEKQMRSFATATTTAAAVPVTQQRQFA